MRFASFYMAQESDEEERRKMFEYNRLMHPVFIDGSFCWRRREDWTKDRLLLISRSSYFDPRSYFLFLRSPPPSPASPEWSLLWNISQALASPMILLLKCMRSSTEDDLFLPHPVKALQKGLFIGSNNESSSAVGFSSFILNGKTHEITQEIEGHRKRKSKNDIKSSIINGIEEGNWL